MRTFIPQLIAGLAITMFGLGGYVAMATGDRSLFAAALISAMVAVVSVCLIPSEEE